MMICPKCSKHNSDKAKFCSGCGTRLAIDPVETVREPDVSFCGNCGKPLKPGAKFCVFCGAATTKAEAYRAQENEKEETPEILPASTGKDYSATVLLHKEKDHAEEEATVLMTDTPALPAIHRAETAVGGYLPPDSGEAPRGGRRTGNGNGNRTVMIVLLAAAGCLLAAAFVAACIYLVPRLGGGDKSSDVVDEGSAETAAGEAETEATVDIVKEEIPKEVLETLETRIGQGAEALEDGNYETETGCMAILETVMEDCVEFADQYKKSDELQELAADAYADYTEAILGQVALLFGQDVRPELYEQMESDLNAGLEQAEKLRNAGFEIDTDMLDEKLASLESDYANRYIERFNTFTEGENWSRTESWDLMNDAESIGLVDYGNMDDPITQRYAYALARVTLKTVETGLNDGSMDYEDAVEELAAVLKDSDYNLLLMYELANCLSHAGANEEAEQMYGYADEIITHIYETQGIHVGTDFPLDHFWSFNEFEEEYSVDSQNGLTKSNHEWIRDYMGQRIG